VEQIPTNATPAYYGSGAWNQAARTLTYTGTGSFSPITYTTLLSTNGDFELSGDITSLPINETMPVTGDRMVSRGDFLRKISGTNVWIYMSQPTLKKLWHVYEDLSGTWLQAYNLSTNGIFQDGWAYWTDTSIGVGLVLSYSVSGLAGSTNIIRGSADVSMTPQPPVDYTIYGDNTVIIPPEPDPVVPVPPPTILSFVWNGDSASLTFTSIVAQAYSVLTNANLSVTNGWRNWDTNIIGQGSTTTVIVPVVEPQLFYRVKSN